MSNRYTLLGLAHARSPWFSNVTKWTTSGLMPADFTKCISATDLRRRLYSQNISAVIIESGVAGIGRDLIDLAGQRGAVVFVIEDRPEKYDAWLQMGIKQIFPSQFDYSELLNALAGHANLVGTYAASQNSLENLVETSLRPPGNLIAVCGPGGTGASTIAIALAQGLGRLNPDSDLTCLADMKHHAEQAMLHAAKAITPAVEDLVDSCRRGAVSINETRSHTFEVESFNYRLLLGPRRPTSWTKMSVHGIQNAITALQKAFPTIVADIEADFEGYEHSGSHDIEERNALSRIVVKNASVVIVVGNHGLKGIYSLGRILREIGQYANRNTTVIPVINKFPGKNFSKIETVRGIKAVIPKQPVCIITSPIFINEKQIEDSIRDASALPGQIVIPITEATKAVIDNKVVQLDLVEIEAPETVMPGSLGLTDQAS